MSNSNISTSTDVTIGCEDSCRQNSYFPYMLRRPSTNSTVVLELSCQPPRSQSCCGNSRARQGERSLQRPEQSLHWQRLMGNGASAVGVGAPRATLDLFTKRRLGCFQWTFGDLINRPRVVSDCKAPVQGSSPAFRSVVANSDLWRPPCKCRSCREHRAGFASRHAWSDPLKQRNIEDLALVLESVLNARARVILEVNVTSAALECVVDALPCIREPTIAPLHGDSGYAVKVVVPREQLAQLIPTIKPRGATDLVISPIAQVAP